MSRASPGVLETVISAAWRRRHLIIIPMLAMPPLGVLAGSRAPEVYEARMTILVQDPGRLNPILHDLTIGPNLAGRMLALRTLLTSRYVMVDVLRDLGQVGPTTDPRVTNARAGYLGQALSVTMIGPEMIELTIRGSRPTGLATALNAVASRFVERILEPARGSVEGSVTFLRRQIDASERELDEAERQYAEFKGRNSDKLTLRQANLDQLAKMRLGLEETQLQLAAADAAYADLEKRVATLNPVVGRLEDAIVQASGELASLRARYTDEHSEVQAALSKLKRLEEERVAALGGPDGADMARLWNQAAGMTKSGEKADTPLLLQQMRRLQDAEGQRAGLRARAAQFAEAVDRLNKESIEFAPIERQDDDLQRAVAAARERHDSLAKRYELARLTGSLGRYGEQQQVKIISAPEDPTSPITPPPSLFVIGSLIASLALGAGLATVFETLDGKLRSESEFEEAAGVPVLAYIPRIEP